MTGEAFYFSYGLYYSGPIVACFFVASCILIIFLQKIARKNANFIELNEYEAEALMLNGFESKLQKTLNRGLIVFIVLPILFLAGSLLVEEALLALNLRNARFATIYEALDFKQPMKLFIKAAPYFCGVVFIAIVVLSGIYFIGRVKSVSNKENAQIEQFKIDLLNLSIKKAESNEKIEDDEFGDIESGKKFISNIVSDNLAEASMQNILDQQNNNF